MTSADPHDLRVLTIEGRGFGGEGWAHVADGFVSIHHTEPGDLVEARIGPFVRGRAWGVVERWLERATTHVDPDCGYYDRCSGCALRHVSETHEREQGLASIRQILDRYGPPDAAELALDWVSAAGRRAHRVRGSFRVQALPGELRMGLRAIGLDAEPQLVDIPDCPAQSPRFLELLGAARGVLGADARAFGAESVTIDAPERPCSARLEVGFGEPPPPDLLPHLARLADDAPDGVGVGISVGSEYRHLAGPACVRHDIGGDGVWVAAPRGSWTPTNPDATRRAVGWAVETLGELGGCAALDVGAGIGFGTAALVAAGASVLAIDRDYLGLRALESACAAAGWPVRTRAGLAHTVLRRLRSGFADGERPDVALVNPMRQPLGAGFAAELAAIGVSAVAYLGPSAVSAARDAAALAEHGFRVARAAAIAQHPGTARVMLGFVARR